MINKDSLISKMLSHIPKWMDIRKRHKTSSGGRLLNSIGNEIESINKYIEEYKKDFFIRNYNGKEDTIIDFIYKAPIGKININDITLKNPLMKITTSIKEFYNNKFIAYYDNGIIYIHKEVGEQIDYIEYLESEYLMTAKLSKMHVWNAYDEFAVFFGLRRFENEDNASLLRRINGERLYPANNNEIGIKNAIKNTLLSFNETISNDDIIIENQTPENLQKYYNEFETIIDHLCTINRDVYKDKIWNIDNWEYDFIKIDYIPHIWDFVIKDYVDGVGQLDDLKVMLIDDNNTSNIYVETYEQSLEQLKKYTTENNINKNISLNLMKYENTIRPHNLKYKINASKLYDITDDNISINRYTNINAQQKEYIQNILHKDNPLNDINIIDNTAVPLNTDFKIRFKPKKDMHTFSINKCTLNGTNVLSEKDGFYYDDNVLKYKYTKANLISCNDYHVSENVYDLKTGGISLDVINNPGILKYDVSSMQNEKILFNYSCILDNHTTGINLINFVQENDIYVPIETPQDKKFIIEDYVNEFNISIFGLGKIKIEHGNDIIEKEINGLTELNTNLYKEKKKLKVEVTALSFDMKILSVKSSKFNIDFSFEYGSLVNINNNYYIPNNANLMTISMTTDNQYSPIIHNVYIGTSIQGMYYETNVIPKKLTEEKLDVITEADVYIVLLTDSGIETEEFLFDRYLKYNAISESSYVKLDLSNYDKIISINSNKGKIKYSNNNYYLYLSKNETVEYINIEGCKNTLIDSISINDYFNINTVNGDKIFISNCEDNFIIKKGDVESLHRYIPLNSGNNIKYKISNNNKYEIVFVLENNSIHVGEEYSAAFSSLYMSPKNKDYHVARNNFNIYTTSAKNIDIINNFIPSVEDNTLMYYKIDFNHDLYDIVFETDLDFYNCNKFSCGYKKLWIKNKVNLSKDMYNIDYLNINMNVNLNGTSSIIPEQIKINENNYIDPKKYIIQSDDAEIEFIERSITAKPNEETEFLYSEYIYPDDDNFNKLEYSNIKKIIDIFIINEDRSKVEVNPADYTVLYNEGIIIWKNGLASNNYTILINYEIKIPKYLKFKLDDVYNLTEHSISAYKLIDSTLYSDVTEDQEIVLDTDNKKFIVKSSNPKYIGLIQNDILKLHKVSENNTVAIKNGYYYIDGNEYYMFSNINNNFINKDKFYETSNTIKHKDYFETLIQSKNFVKNSSMMLNKFDTVHINNCKDIQGSSNFNHLTSCASFNRFKKIGMDISLEKYYNEYGLKFKPYFNDAYAFIDITNYVDNDSYLSFFATKKLKTYIGIEKEVDGYRTLKNNNMIIHKEIVDSNIKEYREIKIEKEQNKRIYLLIQGEGLLDDIIISNNDNFDYRYKLHTKNIDKLDLNIVERNVAKYSYDIEIIDNSDIVPYKAELSHDGYISNSSSYSWDITPIVSLYTKEHFQKCELENIELNNYLFSHNKGMVMTHPIYIGDTDLIKDLYVSINEVLLKSMEGFVVNIYTSNDWIGPYNMIMSSTSNTFKVLGDICNYIKIQIKTPADKIITSINLFAEHKEVNGKSPVIHEYVGEITSKVHDTGYINKYHVSKLDISDIKDINDVSIFIRGAKDNSLVFSAWKEIKFDKDFNILNDVIFDNYRYFEIKIKLNNKDAVIKFNKIKLEVI